MASLTQHPKSPYQTACFTDERGKQVKRSTKEKDKRKALVIAHSWERAAKLARVGELTKAASLRIHNEMMERLYGEGLDNRTTRQHFEDYLTGLQAKEATRKRYRPIFDGFLAYLGDTRANARLASVSSQEIEAFRNNEVKAGKTAATAEFALKVLNGVFEDARRKAVILHNPVQAVRPLIITPSEERRPFTDAQVKQLLAVADTEWQGMILFAYHTGIRLNDAANLTRRNIEGGEVLRFREAKTSHRKQRASERDTKVMMAKDLIDYIKSLPIPIQKDAPLFPSLQGKKSGSAGGLSNTFARLMDKAGIDREQSEERKGKGRRFSALSFHSLRHTMISRLANSDAPEAVRKAMSGHSTDEAHRRYIHQDLEAQKRVVAKAPQIWAA